LGKLSRCKKCKNQPLMSSLSAKINISIKADGKKKWKITPVGAICFTCMYVEAINPYQTDLTFRQTDLSDKFKGKLRK
jgi:hypothetical protein